MTMFFRHQLRSFMIGLLWFLSLQFTIHNRMTLAFLYPPNSPSFLCSSPVKITMKQQQQYSYSNYYFSSNKKSKTIVHERRDDSDGTNETNDITESEFKFPLLPPIGESSYCSKDNKQQELALDDDESKPVAYVASKKFELQYTCKICETRNKHLVSRLAYTQGVVIAMCKKCYSRHLIADNLGWSKYIGGFDGDTNIEEFMDTIGRGDEVNRVSREVFDLEDMIWNMDKMDDGGDNNGDDDGYEAFQ